MSIQSDLAAGLSLPGRDRGERSDVISFAKEDLHDVLRSSAVWRFPDGADPVLPPTMRGAAVHGGELPRWREGASVGPAEETTLTAAWSSALADSTAARPAHFFRVRVDSPEAVRRLRGEIVDGLTIVPSLDSRGRTRALEWRWPLSVGVVPGAAANDWLAQIHDAPHDGRVFDVELCDPGRTYDIVLVDVTELAGLAAPYVDPVDRSACVIVVGDAPADELLAQLERRFEPPIAIAFRAEPGLWWMGLYYEMSHDLPIDVAVEQVVERAGIDGMVAGPRRGLDITASAHWFAALAPRYPELEAALVVPAWQWQSEDGQTSHGSLVIRDERSRGGDPVVVVDGGRRAQPPEEVPPRRLVARTFDDDDIVPRVPPPNESLRLAVRIAIPEEGDAAADKPVPFTSLDPGPTVELEIAVRGDVWDAPPAPQRISLSREDPRLPSTWAVFDYTSPNEGEVVSVEIVLLYRGKPLQAATYVTPVRRRALPGERPTLTTFALTGPDEPTDALRPVDVTLDGRKSDLVHAARPSAGSVAIGDVQEMLDVIEDRVSRVLGDPAAPGSFDDERARGLLITLARLGSELCSLLEPLEIGDAESINILVNPKTPVLPLELAYAGPAPTSGAKVCRHVEEPPPPGEVCDRASTRIVCPYAFWGLYRSIARTVVYEPPRGRSSSPTDSTLSASSVLFAATDIADDGAAFPKPSDIVFEEAEREFGSATRVRNWTAWRKAVRDEHPDVLVVLGHTMREGGETRLYIGRRSSISRVDISASVLRASERPKPLVLLIACASASLGDPFGTLPGALTAKGAGAVVGTLSKIIGPHGADASVELLEALHRARGGSRVADAVADARRSLIAKKKPLGLLLVSHGELDTTVGS